VEQVEEILWDHQLTVMIKTHQLQKQQTQLKEDQVLQVKDIQVA
tara:strand:+ start:339 stop:470 length:132 start_codon:yes stop_codon:yes gene_type:complete